MTQTKWLNAVPRIKHRLESVFYKKLQMSKFWAHLVDQHNATTHMYIVDVYETNNIWAQAHVEIICIE